jgi:1A family penicillin-binding protein
MSEHFPEYGQETGETRAEISLGEPSQALNDPQNSLSETISPAPARITKPLPDPETPLPPSARITRPLPALETPLLMLAKITSPLPDPETALSSASERTDPEQPSLPADSAVSAPAEDVPAPPIERIEEIIELSPRAQRVLLYLARRRMRNARIVKREPASPVSDEHLSSQPAEPLTSASGTDTPPQLVDSPVLAVPENVDALASVSAPESEIEAPVPVEAAEPETLHERETPAVLLVSAAPDTLPAGEPRAAEPPADARAEEATSEAGTPPDLTTSPTSPLANTHIPVSLKPDTTMPAPPLPEPLRPKPLRPIAPGRTDLQRSYPHSTLLSDARQRRLKALYRRQYFSRKHLRRARASDRRASRRLWTTIWSTTTSLLLLFLALASVIGYIAYNFINTTQGTYASQVLTLRDLLPPDNLKIYDGQGNLIDQLTDQGIHTEVKYDQIAPMLVNATVAIEDRTFWSNQGVDITGILRAALNDLENGQAIQGGSTITQQLIKKLIVGDSSDAIRKLSELVLAPQVNTHYSKRDIMEMYLNTIYYGHQAYGIDAAATVYFGLQDSKGKSAASQLDLAQAAMLAGLPRNASLYDPFTNPQSAFDRAYNVLESMVEQGYISQVQAQLAYQEEQSPDFFKSSPTLQDQAPHFDDYVLSQLEQMFHLKRSQLSRSGLKVYTTINVALQKQIQKIMQQHIAEIRDAHHVTNAAEVLIDFHTGAIISMLGSIDYYDKSIDGQFNAALGYRQPGSSFKPYVYVTAFEQGASPAQAIDDAPTTFNNPGGTPPTYSPSNYDLHFHGHMTLRCALQNSLNVPAVRVLQHVGVSNALATAQAMGITSYEGAPGLSMVLGGLDVRLLDHTSAMGVFANGGVREPYYSISKVVQGTTGKVLFQHQPTPGTQVITPQLAYMMTSVLSDNTSRTPEFFDCNVLQLYSNSQQECYAGNRGTVRPAAAKTGTTQDFRDNWTVGYTTDYVMGVWAGNDDNTPMINVTGVQGAAPIWHDAMLLAEQGHPIQNFQNPGGLERATVTYPDGVRTTDWFLPGTVPHSASGPNPEPGQPPVPVPPTGSSPESQPATPYCSTYSFAFPPPAGNGIPANGDWW